MYQNTASRGGAIYSYYGGSISIINSTIGNNSAGSFGGGMGISRTSQVSLSNVTIANNNVTGSTGTGGGIEYTGETFNPYQFTLKNSIIAGNSASSQLDCSISSVTVTSGGYNLIESSSGCNFSAGTGDIFGQDPNLGGISVLGYYPLLLNSPAIDQGNPSMPGSGGNSCEAIDQLGASRPIDGNSNSIARCDIGAYETTPPTTPIVSSLTVADGSPQVGVVNQVYSTLSVIVKDQYNVPVADVVVTFTAPESGASGTFLGTADNQITATTNADGVATAPTFTANDTVGQYVVEATVAGIETPAEFSLENYIPVATTVEIFGGNNQRAAPQTAFTSRLQALVRDNFGHPIGGISVTFTAPLSGAGGTFSGSGLSATVETGVDGVAIAPVFSANAELGNYIVVATASGVSDPINFSLINAAWFVSPGGNNSNSCATPATPCLTIGAAVGKAVAGDSVYVETGEYIGTVNLSKSLSLSGGWDSTFTLQNGLSTINANNSRGILINSATPLSFSIDHFEIYNSNITGGSGGAVYISASTSTINLSYITLRDNKGTDGIGVGLYNSGANVILDHVSIYDNISEKHSSANLYGAVYNNGTLTISNSYIGNNTGGTGAGIYNTGSLTINNSTIADNTSSENGGGIHINSTSSKTININNSTIAYNHASQGGGLYISSASTAPVTIYNSIVGSNHATSSSPNCFGTVNTANTNLLDDISGCTMPAGSYTIADPQLSPIAIGYPMYFPVAFSSPAVEGGDTATCAASDQRGVTRPQGTACDIGAYEFTTPGPAASIYIRKGTNQIALPNHPFELPFSVYVTDASGNPVASAPVTFTAPLTGASGIFVNDSNEMSLVTNEYGIATSSTFTANDILGSYTVAATTTGVAAPASFFARNIVWYVTTTGNDNESCGTSPGNRLRIH